MIRKRFPRPPGFALRFSSICFLLSLNASFSAFGALPEGQTVLVEAEAFQLRSNWGIEGTPNLSGGAALKSEGSESDALTVIDLPAAGTYQCWVRARDFKTQDPGARRFRLVIDDLPLDKEAGAHGVEGYRWEKVGARELSKGEHVLGLRDTTKFFARCDAILLTAGQDDPNTIALNSLARYRLQPKQVEVRFRSTFPELSKSQPASGKNPGKLVASIGNDLVRMTFFQTQGADGKPTFTRQTEVASGKEWIRVPTDPDQEVLFLLFSPASKIGATGFFPSWRAGSAFEFTVGGKTYQSLCGTDPFSAGQAEVLVPVSCAKKEADTIALECATASGRTATVLWKVLPGRRDVAQTITFVANRDGEYSVGFSPFRSWARNEVDWSLLPPVYNYQRLPEHPKLSTSATTPHALALVQPGTSGSLQKLTFAVIADPDRLPFEWPMPNNAKYGFSLLNAAEKVQPTIFSPVLGLADSKMKKGETKTVSWSVLAEPGDWRQALETVSEKVYNVTDYREPYGTSLTEAALNMIDLLKDDEHCGWDARIKGFYNIESRGTATQACPLTLLSAALLSGDEDLYVRRALPAIEYSLSRPAAHFALTLPEGEIGYVTAERMKLTVPSKFYGTAHWQGLHDLLGRKNAWVADIARARLGAATPFAYGSVPAWSDKLAAYRLEGRPELLEQARAGCDQFLEKEVYGRQTKDLGIQPFYNVSYYPYWWDLLDLFEATGDRKYVEAAEVGAFNTIAGLWSQPKTPEGNVTIHPGGKLPTKLRIWWKNDVPYRLGSPLKPDAIQEKEVPAWLVSRVGLGLEQPCTYFAGGGSPMNNILMSAWAPNLLRVYEYTGREIYQTYARNTILSRFANYPGYYVRTFSDLPLNPRYPIDGPDITEFYYHHIPAHLAFTLDFLVSEAAQRSQGEIEFPWVKQQGYVWFSNRIYGGAPGKIYGEPNMSLRFDRKAVQVNSEQVNYLTAQSDRRFCMVLMNEAKKAVSPRIALNLAELGIDSNAGYRIWVNGEAKERSESFAGTVEVPAKGLVVLSFPKASSKAAAAPIPALDCPPVEQKLGGDWGSAHAFRIRSPFGKDSLYVVLTGRPKNGGTVRLELDGEQSRKVDSFPYEFSVYPWPMDKDLKFHLELTDSHGVVTQTSPVTLPGTRAK